MTTTARASLSDQLAATVDARTIMDTNETRDQLRAGDDIEVAPDIDELVIGPNRQDRPLLGRRAVTALVSGMAVICTVGLTGVLTSNGDNSSGPVQPTPVSPTSQDSPAVDVPTSSAMTEKQLAILAVVKAALPDELKVTAHHGIGRRSIVAVAISDSQGLTWVDARVGTTGEQGWDPCQAAKSCWTERVRQGTLYTLQEVETGGNETHYSATYTYVRPDSRYISFNQSNVFDPVGRRSSPPLTDDQVRDLLTAPQWDGFVADCRPDPGPNC
jgi:hypothetical protein